MSKTIDGESDYPSIALVATSSQIITSAASATPTTISVPKMAQTTIITFPDPGADTASVVLTAGSRTIAGNTNFTGLVEGGTLYMSASVTAGASGRLRCYNTSSQIWLGPSSGEPFYVLSAPPPATITTTVTFPDPGVTTASVVLTEGSSTINGDITISSIPAGLDIVADNLGVVAAAFPSTMSLPLSTTTTTRYVATVGSGITVMYTVPTGYYAIVTSHSQYNGSIGTCTVFLAASPDGGTTIYQVATSSTILTLQHATITLGAYIFLPGDSICMSANTYGQTICATFLTFAADGPIRPVVQRPIGTSQVVYTCPAGMRATMSGGFPTFPYENGGIRWYQHSGTAPIYTLQTTISGSTFTVARIQSSAGTVSTGPTCGLFLEAGDTLTMLSSVVPNTASHFWLALTVLPVAIFAPAIALRLAAVDADKAKRARKVFAKDRPERKVAAKKKSESKEILEEDDWIVTA